MFSLLRDAFVNNLAVTADYLIDPGKKNGVAIRIALTRNQPALATPGTSRAESSGGQALPNSSAT